MKELQPTTLLMLTLLRATAKYVHPRITIKKNQLAYKLGIELAISVMNEEYDKTNGFQTLKKELAALRYREDNYFPIGFFNKRTEEREYYQRSLDHALEIVFNLEARFVTGEGDREPRNYRNKFIHLYNDDNTFD